MVHRRMSQDQTDRETMVIDLTGIDLRAIPELPATVFEMALHRLREELTDQPDSYLGFMSALSPDN
jgi:FXSXX-COOH protein